MKPTYELQYRSWSNSGEWISIDKSSSLRKEKDGAIFHSLNSDTRVIEIRGGRQKVVFRKKMMKESNLTPASHSKRIQTTRQIGSAKNGSMADLRIMTPNMRCKADAEKFLEIVRDAMIIEHSKIFLGHLFELGSSRTVVLVPFRYFSPSETWHTQVMALKENFLDSKSDATRQSISRTIRSLCGLSLQSRRSGRHRRWLRTALVLPEVAQ